MSKLLTTLIAVVFAAATSGAVAQTPAPAKGDTTKSAPKGDKAKGEKKAESKKKSEGKKAEAKKGDGKKKQETK
jgi:Ni/Co efflux regulator RcnB